MCQCPCVLSARVSISFHLVFFFSCSSTLLSYFFFFALLCSLKVLHSLLFFFLNTIQFSSIPIQCITTSHVIYLHDPNIRIPSLSIILSPSQTNVSLRFVLFQLFAIWYIRRAIQAITWRIQVGQAIAREQNKMMDTIYKRKRIIRTGERENMK